MSVISKPYFHDTKAAFDHLEKVLWAGEPVCPHCGMVGNATKLQGESTRPGVWKCKTKECRKQFTVTVGTVFESRHIPLPKMLQAAYLMSCSKKGVSAHQLHRILEITYKSAWFLAHRIREAMRDGTLAPMGGSGQTVEADETFIGRLEGQPYKGRRGRKRPAGFAHKNAVLTLVERGGRARSFHIDSTTLAQIVPLVRENIRRESDFMTDEARHYMSVGKEFTSHGAVEHSADEYVRREFTLHAGGFTVKSVHTNTVEGYYSIFKRGMKGVYQHCSEKHLHRYLAEFDFRYSHRVRLGYGDEARTAAALKGIVGKRLTYRNPHVTRAG
jgi:transposase-like protein